MISWSRSSASLIAEPSSKRAPTSSDRMSSREAEIGVGAALVDLGEQDPVRLREHPPGAPVGRKAPQAVDGHPDRPRGPGGGQDPDQVAAQILPSLVVLHAEDRAQDHLERDRLHPGVQTEGPPDRPRGQLPLGCPGHHLLVGPHPFAVKGRQHQLPPAQVLVALQQQEGALPEHRREDDVAARRDRVLAIGPEQALQGWGVGDEDDRPKAEDAGAERVPEPPPAALEERHRAADQPRGLKGRGRPRPRWKGRRVDIPPPVGGGNLAQHVDAVCPLADPATR